MGRKARLQGPGKGTRENHGVIFELGNVLNRRCIKESELNPWGPKWKKKGKGGGGQAKKNPKWGGGGEDIQKLLPKTINKKKCGRRENQFFFK